MDDGSTGPTAAVATLPVPATSFDIRVTLTDLSRSSTLALADQAIRAVIVDCHQAFGGRGLTIDGVFAVELSPGGTALVATGNDPDDVGPAVLNFTGFDFGEFRRVQPRSGHVGGHGL